MEEENVKVFSFQPLFSCFITIYTLLLIFFPLHLLLRIFLSPVLLISIALLFSLFHLGTTQESNTRPEEKDVNVQDTEESNVSVLDFGSDTKPCFVEWNLRAPLEVIHEAYEEDDEDEQEEDPFTRFRETERFSSLSMCYPESDSDSGSDSSFDFPEMSKWMSPEKMGIFRWEDDDDDEDDGNGGEGLIEIKLDENSMNKITKQNQTEFDFHADDDEEEGLIEIHL